MKTNTKNQSSKNTKPKTQGKIQYNEKLLQKKGKYNKITFKSIIKGKSK